MQIESAEFAFVNREALPQWTMRVRILGQGFEQRAAPIVAQVGSQSVQAIMPLLDGGGVQGFLEEEPSAGDELSIGYADSSLIETGIAYDPAIV